MERPTIVVLGFKQTFERNPKTGLMDRPVDWVTYAPVHAVQSTQITERVDIVNHDVGDATNAGPIVALMGNT